MVAAAADQSEVTGQAVAAPADRSRLEAAAEGVTLDREKRTACDFSHSWALSDGTLLARPPNVLLARLGTPGRMTGQRLSPQTR